MATCCLLQTGAIFVLLAISKPCIRFRWSLYRFQPKSPHLSSGTLGFPSWVQVPSFLCKSCICIASRIPHIIPCSCVGYAMHMRAPEGKYWSRTQLGKPRVPLEKWFDFGQNRYKDHRNRMHGLQRQAKQEWHNSATNSTMPPKMQQEAK